MSSSKAAKKAWATRRRKKQERKSAANKAWETMRERYTDEEISDRQREAAYKAWETRRRNARKPRRG